MDPILDTAPCGFLTVTDDGHVAEANATMGEMLSMAPKDIAGKHVDSILAPPGRIFYQTHVFPTLKLQGRVSEVYVSLRDSAGEDVPVLLNIARKPRNEIFVSDWVVVPMRQRNEYENEILRARAAAQDATRAKDEFLAVVSHELRTPLNSIAGWAHLLAGGQLNEEETERALDSIRRSVQHQAKLVDDILDFGRMMTGKLRIELQRMDLKPVIEASVEGVLPAAKAKSIPLHTILEERFAVVMGDPDRLQQVLWNILSNAVKFTPPGGDVKVRLTKVDADYEISVSDTGKGIAAEFLPRVFESFRQEDITGRRQSGLGLGMSIASQLVELHGGTIRASSAGRGQGSTFTVRLPAA